MNEDFHIPLLKERKRRRDDEGNHSITGSSGDNSMKISSRKKRNGTSPTENGREEVDNDINSNPDSKKERGARDRHTHTSKRKTSRAAEDTEIHADTKRKKMRGREVDLEDENGELKVDSPEKEGKTRTRFPNPSKDEGLTEQACKALSYAYMQHKHPSTWKFNKARQNWLLRNWWNEKTITDVHMPLVAQYLANVQGGVKENLAKACHAHLTSRPPPARPDEPQATSENNQLAGPGTEKTAEQIRSKVLLEALSAT